MAKKTLATYQSENALPAILILSAIFLCNYHSYLLFHSFAELFSIVIACGTFMIAWNMKEFVINNFIIFLGTAYIFIAVFDMLHMLAYKGMGVFQVSSANLSVQVWIAARYMESLSLLAATFFIKRKLNTNILFLAYLLCSIILLGAIFYWDFFPDCFVEDMGLTSFKKYSEYLISFILFVSLYLFHKLRHEFDVVFIKYISWAVIVTIVAEIMFTIYIDVYGMFNLIGHLLKIISFYLVYKAITHTGLKNFYNRMFMEISEKENRYRQLLQTTRDGFWILDESGKVVDVNEAYCRMSGYTKDELLQLSINDLDAQEKSEETLKRTERIIEKGSDLFEARHKRKDGSVFDVEVSVTYFNRKRHSFVCFSRDITESKMAIKERERLQSQLIQAQKMESVGRLAGGVAHDFNNMLGVILGHTEMMKEQAGQAHPFFEGLVEIEKAATRSADLTRQLLAFARKQTISPKVLDLNETIENILTMLRRLIGEDIDLEWHPHEKLWMVNIDPSQIDQILANLCVNARDAISDTGKVTIETGTVVFDEDYCSHHRGFIPGEYVLMALSDNGCGMQQETLTRIFEPFFTTKGLGKGTGLGLATVYGIVKQNEGFINVYSEPGEGTIFKIYLPRHIGKPSIKDSRVIESPEKGNETILLVEDDPSILKITLMMLQRLGYSILPASTPGEAITLAREHMGKIDLMITDVVMPEMNGRDLSQKILSLYPDLKCLFMSGYTANVIAHHGVLEEGVHFIQKPFSMNDLASTIKNVIHG
ncbi:putative Histidine kinase [Desulfamplus magnetovallimortis]|uniref:histidine kinase n=1 Tax=Desulfamplus magnetovallimortis TaxID=1246637 RepID=A0A1W1HJD7_9BACT|nr:MASE3 domain-containing protein [Desulfamplus magnetovallimortis]SLM32574.1 putative Histidine kinase [Desulfamplus magnetovallimortis]